ncbi:hypothetical protein GCM10022247_15500 [Allokutzneria multivorans]|uniref:Uncharacterized protein n=1 Tax=Allokutzneria multivorans TaxID=1142134 RepID=A0ABP7RES0_9PSEU
MPPPPVTGTASELRYLDVTVRASQRQLRTIWLSAAAMWSLGAFVFTVGARKSAGMPILVLAALTTAFAVAQYMAVGRWLRAATRMFAAESWRPVAVRAVRGRFLELESDRVLHVRLAAAMDPLLQAVGRAEQLWIVGPDECGWVALHLADVRTPLPGRVVPERPDVPVTAISAYDPQAPASADVVTSGAARLLMRYSRQLYAPAKIVLAIGLGVLISGLWTGNLVPAAVSTITVPIAAVLFVRARKRLGGWAKLDQLLDAGPWQRVQAELDEPWQPNARGFADGTATLTLPDGERTPVRLPLLGFDVAEYVRNTGTVWIAGEPGATFAVGAPGSPVIAVADQVQSGPRRAQVQA